MRKKPIRNIILVLLIAALAWALPSDTWRPTDASALALESSRANSRVIHLGQSGFLDSRANAIVAEILLEEVMGYHVEVHELPSTRDMTRSLITGHVHASLEKWDSTVTAGYRRYLQAGIIENIGPLGIVGHSYWYVPTYLAEQYPQLKSWRGLQDPEMIKLLQTSQTGERGQLLSGDPTWRVYLEDIIRNLELDFEVVYTGSETSLLRELDRAYQAQEPILIYFWEPHVIHTRYDLTHVELPPHTKECYAQADEGGVDCGYPEDNIFKVANPQLREQAPEAYKFLTNFAYPSNQSKLALVKAIDQTGSLEQGARMWLAQNEPVWRMWVPGSLIGDSQSVIDCSATPDAPGCQ